MPSEGTYYLGRISKLGFEKDMLYEAISNPKPISIGEYSWTITDINKIKRIDNDPYIFGKLTKFIPEGHVKVLDRNTSSEKDQLESDLIIASSPFVYIPEYAGIAYLHIWNQIEQKTFINRFEKIIIEKYDNFFIDFRIKPITDLVGFLEHLSKFSSINMIKARVTPPNPLYGHLWKSLKKYLENRKIDELKIEEKSKRSILLSKLMELIKLLLSNDFEKIKEINPDDIDIGDAAMIMAIDGYGEGKIEGLKNKKRKLIGTNEKIVNFKHQKETTPEDLYNKAKEILDNISINRYMEH